MKSKAGKKIKFTNFNSRNLTKNAEAEENNEEFVINVIAQLAMVYGRIGRRSNQSTLKGNLKLKV